MTESAPRDLTGTYQRYRPRSDGWNRETAPRQSNAVHTEGIPGAVLLRGSWLLFPSWRMAYRRLAAGPWVRLGAFFCELPPQREPRTCRGSRSMREAQSR